MGCCLNLEIDVRLTVFACCSFATGRKYEFGIFIDVGDSDVFEEEETVPDKRIILNCFNFLEKIIFK